MLIEKTEAVDEKAKYTLRYRKPFLTSQEAGQRLRHAMRLRLERGPFQADFFSSYCPDDFHFFCCERANVSPETVLEYLKARENEKDLETLELELGALW